MPAPGPFFATREPCRPSRCRLFTPFKEAAMNRSSKWIVAAAIVSGTATFNAGTVRAADDAVKVERTQTKANARDTTSERGALPAGVKAREAEDSNDIHKAFEGFAEAAHTKNHFDNVVERLVDQDHNRIGN